MAKISSKLLLIIASVFIVSAVTITCVVVFYRPRSSVLKIYNWEDYIDEDLIKEFQTYYREVSGDKKFKVKYDTFTDNEELLTKLEVQGRDYDIAFPSEYMVEKLIKKNLVKPIDTTNEIFTNYDTTNLDSTILTKTDTYAKVTDDATGVSTLYAIPYIYGTLGIMYDIDEMGGTQVSTEKTDIELLESMGWGALFDNIGTIQENADWKAKYRGKITMKKSARDSVGIAMLYSNNSSLQNGTASASDVINMKGTYTLAQAEKALTDQISSMKPTYENDEGKSRFADPDDHSFAFGLYWSCDAGLVMADNPNLKYYTPTYTNFWIDNFVLPTTGTKDQETLDASYAFINFMLDKENALKNMDYVGSASAIKLTTAEKEELNDGTIFPTSTVISNGAVMHDFETDEIESSVNDLIISIMNKSAQLDEGGSNLLWLWILLSVLGAGGLAYLTYFLLTHRRLSTAPTDPAPR
jgi:spermidine/putrescine transport system substrate-binding protein